MYLLLTYFVLSKQSIHALLHKTWHKLFQVIQSIKILLELSLSNKHFTDLMNNLDLKQTTLSNHLSKLKEYGMVYTLKRGGTLEVRLNREVLHQYLCDELFNPKKFNVESFNLESA